MSTTFLRDAGHLSETKGSNIGVELLHGLDERALCQMGCPGLELTQAQVVPWPIVAGDAGASLGEDSSRLPVLSYLA